MIHRGDIAEGPTNAPTQVPKLAGAVLGSGSNALVSPNMTVNIEDFSALRTYLATRMQGAEPVSIERLSGGVSNRAVRIQWPGNRAWVLKQALKKLRVQAEWYSAPERIFVEAKALRCFNRIAPPGTTPAILFHDEANYLLAMEAVPEGHYNWKSLLLSGHIVPAQFRQFGELLGTLHRNSSSLSNREKEEFSNTSHFQSLRLEPYYGYSARREPAAAAFLEALTDDLLHHKIALVHGDFSPKNTLIYQKKLVLLDFEVVHLGDPAFDIGFALAHFLSKAHHLQEYRRQMIDATRLFWITYNAGVALQPWALKLEERAVRNTLGCLLARTIGKSPLEYLTNEEIERQRDAALQLMKAPPKNVLQTLTEFTHKIESYAQN